MMPTTVADVEPLVEWVSRKQAHEMPLPPGVTIHPLVCAVCQTPTDKRCGACNFMAYCSLDCSRGDWPVHRRRCVRKSDPLHPLRREDWFKKYNTPA